MTNKNPFGKWEEGSCEKCGVYCVNKNLNENKDLLNPARSEKYLDIVICESCENRKIR